MGPTMTWCQSRQHRYKMHIAHGCLCKLVLMQKTHIITQFCQVTTHLELDMGRGQILSLVLLLFLRSFILPCQGKPRGGRGGGGRGGGRGGRGGGGWRWFGGSSYSSGSRYHTTRSYSVVTTPKPTPETILSPTGAGKDNILILILTHCCQFSTKQSVGHGVTEDSTVF